MFASISLGSKDLNYFVIVMVLFQAPMHNVHSFCCFVKLALELY